MTRSVLALALCCLALQGAPAAAAPAGDELSRCLDPSTTLNAGGDVSDKELTAAESACAQLKQSIKDSKILARVNAAAETLATEAKHRQASGH